MLGSALKSVHSALIFSAVVVFIISVVRAEVTAFRTVGHVVRLEQAYRKGEPAGYNAIVRLTDAGGVVRTVSVSVPEQQLPEPGAGIRVIYDPELPTPARLEAPTWQPLALIACALALLYVWPQDHRRHYERIYDWLDRVHASARAYLWRRRRQKPGFQVEFGVACKTRCNLKPNRSKSWPSWAAGAKTATPAASASRCMPAWLKSPRKRALLWSGRRFTW